MAKSPILNRRAVKAEERRAAILAIARRHFGERGYGGASMSAIAAELGGSKGTLWAYFATKEELFAATLEALIAEYAPFLALAPDEPLEPTLLRYTSHFLGIMLSPKVIALNRLVIAEAPRFPEIGRIFWEQGPQRRHRALADFFAAKMAAGEMRLSDPLRTSAQFHHLCHYHLVMRELWGVPVAPDPATVRDDAMTSVRLFLHGVLPASR